jgi:hypothetical protein
MGKESIGHRMADGTALAKRVRETTELVEVPSRFLAMARDYPNRVEQAIALMETPDEAAEELARNSAYHQYAKHIKASVDAVNHLQHGRFKLEARIGQFFPRSKGGRGIKTPEDGSEVFGEWALARFRRMADYAQFIDPYFERLYKSEEEGEEATVGGFLRFVKPVSANGTSVSHAIPETFRDIHDCPAVLIGSGWWQYPVDHARLNALLDLIPDWGFRDWFSKTGAIIAIRTLNLTEAEMWADVLVGNLEFSRLPWRVALTGINKSLPWEPIVFATTGDVDIKRFLPAREKSLVRCCNAGPEAQIRSWLAPFARAQGGAKAQIIELGATEKHKGFYCLTVDGDVLA